MPHKLVCYLTDQWMINIFSQYLVHITSVCVCYTSFSQVLSCKDEPWCCQPSLELYGPILNITGKLYPPVSSLLVGHNSWSYGCMTRLLLLHVSLLVQCKLVVLALGIWSTQVNPRCDLYGFDGVFDFDLLGAKYIIYTYLADSEHIYNVWVKAIGFGWTRIFCHISVPADQLRVSI